MKRSAWLWLAAAAWAACAQEVPHDGPYDPASPLEKQARASVSGTVLLEGETDHAGVDVRLQNGDRTYTAASDGDGRFTVTGVVPGTYAVHAETRYFAAREATLVVAAGAATGLAPLTLAAKRAAVRGVAQAEHISGRTSTLAGGVAVRLTRRASIRGAAAAAPFVPAAAATAAGETYATVSDENGDYALEGVPVGVYTLGASAGELSAEGATVTVDGAADTVAPDPVVLRPLTGFFEIAGSGGVGAAYTNTAAVTLRLSGFNATQAALGASATGLAADCTFGTPRTYAATAAFTLAGGDGPKTVCVKYLDDAGRETDALTAAITLDTAAPGVPAVRVGGGAPVNDAAGAVALALTAADAGSGLTRMKVANLPSGTCPAALAAVVEEPYAAAKAWYLATPGAGIESTRTVCAAYGDAAGNWSAAVSDTVVYDTQPPAASSGGIAVAGGAAETAQAVVRLDLYAAGAAEMMLASDAAFTGAAWEPFRATTTWALSAGDGTKTVYVRFRDAAGNTAGPFSDLVVLDTAPPASPGVQIGAGAAYTGAAAVTLTLGAAGATRMQVSNDGVFDTEAVEAYATLKAGWSLGGGDGAKTVSVRFFDDAGNASGVANAQVTLDTTPPAGGAVAVNAGAAYATLANGAVTLSLAASDAGAGLQNVKLANLTAGTCATALAAAAPAAYAALQGWFLTAPGAGVEAPRTVCASFGDAVGNWSAPVSDSVTYDTRPPTAWGGGVVLEGGAAYTRATLVKADLPVTGAVEMMLSADAGFAGAQWESYRVSTPWYLVNAQGTQTLYVKFRDAAGNIAGPFSDDIELDSAPPASPQVRINAGAAFSAATTVTLTLSAQNATQMQVSNDGIFDTEPTAAYATTLAGWTIAGGDGSKTVYARFFDDAGNTSAVASATVLLDTTPPASATLAVDGGAATVNRPSGAVALALGALDAGAGVREMKVANLTGGGCAAALAAAGAESYLTAKAWYLAAPGAGVEAPRTVCAAFTDAAGNWSDPVSDSVAYDTQAPTAYGGGIVIDGGAAWATETLVQLDLPVTGAAEMMLAADAAFTGAQWESYRASTPWYLPLAQGSHTVWVKFRDAAGNVAGPYSGAIQLDTVAPSTPAVQIDGGAAYAVTTAVDLVLSASGATRMQVSDDGVFDGEPVQTYATSIAAWPLPPGDGVKAVYARFLDDAGNASPVASALVFLDMTPPSDGSVMINDGDAYTRTAAVTLSLASAAVYEMAVLEGACPGAGATWVAYAPAKAFTLVSSDGPHTVYARYRDQAGNQSQCVNATITLDRSYADAPTVTLAGAEGLAGRTRNMVVSLKVAGSLTDTVEMQIANDGGFAGAAWSAVTTATQWQVPFGDALKTVYARFRDRAGNESPTYTPIITLDTTGPDTPGLAVIDVNGDGFALDATAVEMQWSVPVDAHLAGFEVERYVLNLDLGFRPLTALGPAISTFVDADASTTGYRHYYRVRAFDDLGNESSWSVMADAEPFAPVDSVRYVLTEWGVHYDFMPKTGTNSIHSSYSYTGIDGFVYQMDLNADTIFWDRPTATTLIFNDVLRLKTGNSQGTLSWVSDFNLGLNTRETLSTGGNNTALRQDRNGHLHLTGSANAYTEKGIFYANDVTGTLAVTMIDPDAQYANSSTARFADMAMDAQGRAHIVYARQYSNASNTVTGATLWYAYPSGGSWVREAVTSTTASPTDTMNWRPRIVLDSGGNPVIGYAMSFPWRVGNNLYVARRSGGAWSNTYVAAGSVPAFALDATGNAVFIANYWMAYMTDAGGTWSTYAFPATVSMTYPELTTDTAGNLHLVFYNTTYKQLVYANNIGGSWNTPQVLQTGVQGLYPGIHVAADGSVHIVFLANGLGEEQYWTNASGTWVKTRFDEDIGTSMGFRSLVMTAGGLRILYNNAMTAELRLLKMGQPSLHKDTLSVPPLSFYGWAAAQGPSGNLHAVYSGYASSYGYFVTYSTNAGGAWGPTLTIRPPCPSTDVAIGVDTSDTPHIAYTCSSSALYYADFYTGFSPLLLSTTPSSANIRMIMDATGLAHLVYSAMTPGNNYTTVRHTVIAPGGGVIRQDEGPTVSGWTHLAMLPSGDELFAYSDTARANWVLPHGSAAGWGTPELVDADGGIQGSLVVDSAGFGHMAYLRLSSNTLRYATNAPDGVWRNELIDDAGDVGRNPNLVLDAAGKVHVLYNDKGSSTLKYATNEPGGWITTKVVPVKQLKYYPAFFDPSGALHTFYLDRSTRLVHIGGFAGWLDAFSTARSTNW